MRLVPRLTFAILMLHPTISLAAEELPPSDILVIGLKNPYALNAKILRTISAVYKKKRGFAPHAALRFRIYDSQGIETPLRVWVQIGDDRSDITVRSDGTIDLPPATFQEGASLKTNRPRGAIRIRPEILSPGTTQHARRLGDLRLQCLLGWAIEGGEAPIVIRTAFAMAGGVCSSKMIGVAMSAPFPVTKAEIADKVSRKAVQVTKGGSYWPPLYDRSLSNDAVLMLE